MTLQIATYGVLVVARHRVPTIDVPNDIRSEVRGVVQRDDGHRKQIIDGNGPCLHASLNMRTAH